MKLAITSIRLTRVSIPLTMVHAGSMYVIQKTERTVVELVLENGVTGLGETWGTPDVYALAQRFARDLLGKDALNRFSFNIGSCSEDSGGPCSGKTASTARASARRGTSRTIPEPGSSPVCI